MIEETKRPTHLRFSCLRNDGHAQDVMASLGITYLISTPQMMGDQWWFWCCENVPEPLPNFLTVIKFEPEEAIGYGLSEEDVKIIRLNK